jgi:glycosyltransferase involved in cell wall biosynthesis
MNFRQLPQRIFRRTQRAQREGLTSAYEALVHISETIETDRVGDFARKGLWNRMRSYRPNGHLEIAGIEQFEQLLSRIATGRTVPQEELLPFLCLERKVDRAQVNALLADSYSQRQTEESFKLAGNFIRRAWLLSDFDPKLLDLYVKILSQLRDIEGIRDAYKRVGIAAARRGNLNDAIRYFDLWQWTYFELEKIDKYEYDFDILDCMEALADLHRVETPMPRRPAESEKIKLAYLLRGMNETNSILIAISLEFAKHHDTSRFNITFFAPETESAIRSSADGANYLAAFEKLGYSVVTAPPAKDLSDRLLGLAKEIRSTAPDILVSYAACIDFSQYLLSALRLAPIVMGIVQGPPAQFAAPNLDWTIAWTKHPLMDCPVNCSWVQIKLDYPVEDLNEPYTREELGFPVGAQIVLSAGRHPKFQNEDFWSAIVDLLQQHPKAQYVVVGPRKQDVPALPEKVVDRIHFLGWRQDFLRILPNADVLIDTYPNGGGQVIVQAMSQGIPVVAHRNNYLRLFDQNDWNPVEDFIQDPEILVPRGDFDQLKRVVSRLLADENYRRDVGERCRAEHVRHADVSKAIRGCEAVYVKVIDHFASLSDVEC